MLYRVIPFVIWTFWRLSSNFISATAIENGVIGNPEVECGRESVIVVFNTQQPFGGRVFVKGFADQSNCQSISSSEDSGRRTAGIEVAHNSCGVTRLRSASPAGLFITVQVLVSFHPRFITKVDKAFDVMCFYMQASKTVSYPVSVSMIPLNPLLEVAEMPRCRYQVLVDGPNGEPAKTVAVGQQLFHKWTCESNNPEMWCMLVYNCYVDDGTGTQIEILDSEGCAIDKYVLQNLDYAEPLMASRESHAFKFADKVIVNFQCSVRLDIRNESGMCQHPQCSAASGRNKRQTSHSSSESWDHSQPVSNSWDQRQTDPAAVIDVKCPPIDVLDIDDQIADARFLNNKRLANGYQICVSPWSIWFEGTVIILLLTYLTICIIVCYKRTVTAYSQ